MLTRTSCPFRHFFLDQHGQPTREPTIIGIGSWQAQGAVSTMKTDGL
ncbi:hypothetical protein QC762_0045980 [Podospora pseudocomata]|uniref:Uncharacterized protein n=1 Tax=Podospora pseudocomata TaxID=2093779 RepID=A0ABR0GNX6_9PEZI|nr:hypothetical protein QC762_0045980 [Podospora pseudocomata]